MIGEQQNKAALKRLKWRKPKASKSTPLALCPDYPTAVMEVSGGDLGDRKPKIIFKQKHGVWFWNNYEKPLSELHHWGDTLPAIERMCRRLNYSFHFLTAPDVRGATHGLTA